MICITKECLNETGFTAIFYDDMKLEWFKLHTNKFKLGIVDDVDDTVVEDIYYNKKYDSLESIEYNPGYEVCEEYIALPDLAGLKKIDYSHNIFETKDSVLKVIIIPFDIRMIRKEVQQMKRFDHPNIMKYKYLFKQDGLFRGYSMDKGVPLSKFSKEDAKVKWLSGVYSAIMYMNFKRFHHRDIKPDNIIIVNDEAKIIDLNGEGYTPEYSNPDNRDDDIYSFNKILKEYHINKSDIPPHDYYKYALENLDLFE